MRTADLISDLVDLRDRSFRRFINEFLPLPCRANLLIAGLGVNFLLCGVVDAVASGFTVFFCAIAVSI